MSSKPTVLVVEDDPMIRQLVTGALSSAGFDVLTAETGGEALAHVVQTPPDVIVSDVRMPGIDGLQFLRILRGYKARRHIPVILLTSLDAQAQIVEGLELGADDYITKPVKVEELVARVQAKIRRPSVPVEDLPRDGRTGLRSERAFREELQRELARPESVGSLACLSLAEIAKLRGRLSRQAVAQVATQLAELVGGTETTLDVIGTSGDATLLFLMPETDCDTARARLHGLSRAIARVSFDASGEKLRLTPVAGIVALSSSRSVDELLERAGIAMAQAALQLDLQPAIYDRAVAAQAALRVARERAGRDGLWHLVGYFGALPLQLLLMLGVGLGLPFLFYWVAGRYAVDVTRPAAYAVAAALVIGTLERIAEALLALGQIEPLPAAETRPKASAIITAQLPADAAALRDTVDAFLELIYPLPPQIILAYSSPREFPIEAELRELASRQPRFVLLKVPYGAGRAQLVNAALRKVDGAFVGLFETGQHPERHSLSRAWRWLSNGYSVVQGHSVVRNGATSWLARAQAVECEIRHAVTAPGRRRLYGFGVFDGTNGYWKTDVLRNTRLHGFMTAEDIDAAMRVVLQQRGVVVDARLVASQLAPITLGRMCRQQLQRARGWVEASRSHLGDALQSDLPLRQKAGLWSLLGWSLVSAWLPWQVIPLLTYWFLRHRPLGWSLSLVAVTLGTTLVSAAVSAGVATVVAEPRLKDHPWWFVWYVVLEAVGLGELRNAVNRLAQVKELMGERSWKVTSQAAATAKPTLD